MARLTDMVHAALFRRAENSCLILQPIAGPIRVGPNLTRPRVYFPVGTRVSSGVQEATCIMLEPCL